MKLCVFLHVCAIMCDIVCVFVCVRVCVWGGGVGWGGVAKLGVKTENMKRRKGWRLDTMKPLNRLHATVWGHKRLKKLHSLFCFSSRIRIVEVFQ